MNIDKFLKIFVPKDHSFFPLFEDSARNLVKATELLLALLKKTEIEDREALNKEIREIEHYGDKITNETYDQLNKSFITPFDREDIHELAAHLDDVVDSINGISRRICLYKPKKLIPVYVEIADMIHEAALEIEKGVSYLHDAGNKRSELFKVCERVKEIEHEADEAYFSGVSGLFEYEEDPRELLKNNKILEILERCVDEEEDVTDTLRAIIIKMT